MSCHKAHVTVVAGNLNRNLFLRSFRNTRCSIRSTRASWRTRTVFSTRIDGSHTLFRRSLRSMQASLRAWPNACP